MPTGYTAGILDGTTTDFKTFALHCARAFGATMHMRDEPFDAPYKAPEPSDYHAKRIAESNAIIAGLETLTDQDLIDQEHASLVKTKEQYEKSKAETEDNKGKLQSFLDQAINFKAPSPEHEELHTFMCKQLHETIKFDGGTRFYDERLAEIETSLLNLNAESIRNDRRVTAYKDLAYNTEKYQKELKRCQESKKWMDDLLGVL